MFERGGKREKRTLVARDTTDVAAKSAADAERQLAFQTEQAFINVLLANSSLDLARENLKNFSNVLDVNRERLSAGDLAEAEFYKISLQKLQFEQDLSSAEVAVVQAKAALRQNVGYENLTDEFEIDGDLGLPEVSRHPRRSQAGGAGGASGSAGGAGRRDSRSAHSGARLRESRA